MAVVFYVEKYKPKFGECFFFDNNVWIYLFYPHANVGHTRQKIYSAFLNSIKRKKCAVFINSLVISEFSNYWLQTDFKLFKKKNPSSEYKKNFVGSEIFKNSVDLLKDAINKIIQISDRANDNFNAIELNNLLNEFGKCDFNDAYYIELARMNNWKIVTDDKDFFKDNKINVDVITTIK